MTRLPALLLGATTAVGGGCIRDVLSGRTPKIFERGELYAIAAAFGAAMFLLCELQIVPRNRNGRGDIVRIWIAIAGLAVSLGDAADQGGVAPELPL